jgi:hypothetical protein
LLATSFAADSGITWQAEGNSFFVGKVEQSDANMAVMRDIAMSFYTMDCLTPDATDTVKTRQATYCNQVMEMTEGRALEQGGLLGFSMNGQLVGGTYYLCCDDLDHSSATPSVVRLVGFSFQKTLDRAAQGGFFRNGLAALNLIAKEKGATRLVGLLPNSSAMLGIAKSMGFTESTYSTVYHYPDTTTAIECAIK